MAAPHSGISTQLGIRQTCGVSDSPATPLLCVPHHRSPLSSPPSDPPLKPFLGLKYHKHMLSCAHVFIHCNTA